MNLSRRGFLAAFTATAVMDPERLLWRPGAKLISIPNVMDSDAALIAATRKWLLAQVEDDQTRDILRRAKSKYGIIWSNSEHLQLVSS